MNVQNAKSFRYQFLKYQRRCGINFFLTIRRSRPLTAAAELRALENMGNIDQTTHTLTCQCGAVESVRILESGSQYGSTWGKPKKFINFSADWSKAGFRGPEIIAARCNKCSSIPKIQIS